MAILTKAATLTDQSIRTTLYYNIEDMVKHRGPKCNLD